MIPTASGTPRRLRRILIASLAANVFLLGFIGAEAWRARHRGDGLGAGALPGAILPRILERLPPPDGRLLRDAFARRLPELVERRRGSRQATERLRVEIARTPLDPEGVRRAMREAREARARVGALVQEILVDALPRMSDEGRRTLGEQRLLRP